MINVASRISFPSLYHRPIIWCPQLFVLAAVLAVVAAAPQGYGSKPASGYGAPEEPAPAASEAEPSVDTGYGSPPEAAASGQEGNIAGEPAAYNFEYAVEDEESGNNFGQQEARDGDSTSGSYYVQMADGRMQIVNYSVEPDTGYVVEIQVNTHCMQRNAISVSVARMDEYWT